MKVVFLGRYNPSEILTGPQKVAKRIFHEYTQTSNAVFIEYFFDGTKYGILKKLFGKEIIVNEPNSMVLRLGILRLIFYLVKKQPSIIHIITYERFAIVSIIFNFFFRTIILYNIHGNIYHEDTNFKKVPRSLILKDKICEKFFLKYSRKLLFLSEESIDIATKTHFIDRSKIEIVPNGIDNSFYNYAYKKPESFKRLNIVFIGSIKRSEKGFEFIMRCLKNVSFTYEFYIISKNPGMFIESLDKNLHFIKNKDTVEFARFVQDKDIFLSGSLYEPFSLAAVECMASGMVPIVTKETGMSRYIKHLYNGFVFSYNDVSGFINALEILNSNRKLLNEMSERARTIYFELNWKKVCERYITIYDDLEKRRKY